MANFSYKLDKHLIIVPVILCGKNRQSNSEFVLDTGASFTVIDHSLAELLGYSARDGIGQSLYLPFWARNKDIVSQLNLLKL